MVATSPCGGEEEGRGEWEGEAWEWLARGDTLRRRGIPEPLRNEGGPWSLRDTPAMCLLVSPILREPDRCWRKAGAEEVEGARVALRVCFGEGVFRPPMSSCLKQMHSPFTLLWCMRSVP